MDARHSAAAVESCSARVADRAEQPAHAARSRIDDRAHRATGAA